MIIAFFFLVNSKGASVEETEDLSSDMVLSGLNMVHNSLVGGKNDKTELSGWENTVNEFLEVLQFKVESWGDDTALVKSSIELNNDLSRSVVVNDFELVDISMLLHDSKELDNDL